MSASLSAGGDAAPRGQRLVCGHARQFGRSGHRRRTIPLPRTQPSDRGRLDDCMARMMRKSNRKRATSDVALLLFCRASDYWFATKRITTSAPPTPHGAAGFGRRDSNSRPSVASTTPTVTTRCTGDVGRGRLHGALRTAQRIVTPGGKVAAADQARLRLADGPDALILCGEPQTIGLLRELRTGEILRADSATPVLVVGVDDDSAAVRYYRAGRMSRCHQRVRRS